MKGSREVTMSVERLREMLGEATPGKWKPYPGFERAVSDERGKVIATAEKVERGLADARLIALAPDAIALLADFADAVTDRRQDGTFRDDKIQAVLLRLDVLCGDER